VFLEPVSAQWHTVHAADLHYGSRLARAWDAAVTLGQPAAPAPVEAAEEPVVASRPAVAAAAFWRPVLLFVPLAIGQGALFAYAMSVAPARMPSVQRAVAVDANALPATLAGLTRVDFKADKRSEDNIHGMYSRTFHFRGPDDTTYVASFDFPFSGGWHELTMCYLATGWEKSERRVRTAPAAAGGWQYVEADFQKPGGLYGTVMYSEFDQSGIELRPHEGWERPADSYFEQRNFYLESSKTFQVQVFVAGAAPLSDAQRRQAAELLLAVRERFHQLITTPGAPGANEK
jgi:hypothetical protein